MAAPSHSCLARPTVVFCEAIVSTGSDNIGQECLAAHLIFAERNN